MRVTVEMSLYPLAGDALDKILGFVLDVLRAALERSFGAGGSQALVVKFLNADLPIGEPPVLESPRASRRR